MAVKAAEQMHGIRQVAAGVRPRRFEEGVQIRMARAAFARDASELSLGNADRLGSHQSIALTGFLRADRPIDRHSFPLV
jgi:hypothetical protein